MLIEVLKIYIDTDIDIDIAAISHAIFMSQILMFC